MQPNIRVSNEEELGKKNGVS